MIIARPKTGWQAKAPAPQSGIAATKTGPTRAAAADQGGPPHKSSQAAKIFRSSSTLAFFHIPWRAGLQFEPDRLAPTFGDEARASARGRGSGVVQDQDLYATVGCPAGLSVV